MRCQILKSILIECQLNLIVFVLWCVFIWTEDAELKILGTVAVLLYLPRVLFSFIDMIFCSIIITEGKCKNVKKNYSFRNHFGYKLLIEDNNSNLISIETYKKVSIKKQGKKIRVTQGKFSKIVIGIE